MTDSAFDHWRFQHNAIHINGGKEFFGWGHRCLDQPRLLVIDKYFKKTRSSQRSYLVDGKTQCTTAAEALAALAAKPVLTDDDRVLLRSLPSDSSWIKPEKRGPLLPLVDMGLVEWNKNSDGEITCRLTEAGRAEIAT